MTLLLCPVRPGDDNDELRYALRSWETNLLMPLDLAVVGHCPNWLKPDEFIPGNRFKSSPLAIFDNIRLGSIWLTGHEYLLMNDDFFCMDPMSSIVPVRRNLTLDQHVALAGPAGSDLWYPASLRLTRDWLVSQGYPSPWSWEAHRPLPVQAQGMVEAIEKWRVDNPGQFDRVPQARTLYAVTNGIHGYPVEDCKLGTNSAGVGSPWLSTSDQSWRRFQTSIKKRFQKPSRWERA